MGVLPGKTGQLGLDAAAPALPDLVFASGSRLWPFVPRLAVDWIRSAPEQTHRRVDAALAFVDVSGFTALTERLAARGKAGAEEVSDLVSGCFTELLDCAYGLGGQMLKWGGDAALIFYDGPGSARRAARAAWTMCRLMERIGTLRTSVGPVELRVSIGIHHGPVDLYLVGKRYRELVVTGPGASAVCAMEHDADAGDVLLSPATARQLPPELLGERKGGGVLLAGPPDEEPNLSARADNGRGSGTDDVDDADLELLFPPPTLSHLLAGGEQCEHRQAAVAFVEFSGADAVVDADGPEALVDSLEHIVRGAQEVARAEGVNLHTSDVGADGGKLLVLGGIPVVQGNDEERVLRAALSIVRGGGGQLRLRAGVNRGQVFMHESGPDYRRIHSFAGDAVNLAARVMAKAAPGQVLATAEVLARTRTRFEADPLEPFLVKGKEQPVEASVVGAALRTLDATLADQFPLSFVGRAGELRTLLDAAADAESGRGRVVQISAEAGMGKSTLVAAARRAWALRTYRLASEEYGRSTPYLPFRWLLRAVLELDEGAAPAAIEARLRSVVEEDVPELLPWLPLVGDVLGLSLPATPEVEQLDRRFLRGWLEQSVITLLCATVTYPAALLFEDIHEIDDASRELLARLAEQSSGRPWLILATRRPEGDALPDDVADTHLELEPLDDRSALDLVTDISAGALGDAIGVGPADLAVLVERAGGNPLFLRELVLAAAEAGSIEHLPDRIEPLLAAKVDRLEPADRQVLRAAAVLGIRFDPSMVPELLEPSALADAAMAGGFDGTVWDRLGGYVVDDTAGSKRFFHALIRDAAYEGLAFRRRHELHGRAADAIAARTTTPGEQADLLSLHSLHAQRYEDAWRFSCLAGEQARAVYANADAVVLFDRALDASRHLRGLSHSDVATVAEALGDVAELAGRYSVARSGYDRARRLTTHPVVRARLLRKTGVLHERTGEYSKALRCYTRGRTLLTSDDPVALGERAELAVGCAAARFRQGRMRQSNEWATVGAQEAEAAEQLSGLAHALFLVDASRQLCGEDWGPGFERALAIYRDLGDLVGQGNVLNNLGIAHWYEGHLDEALHAWEAARDVRLRSGDTMGAATQENNMAETYSDQGRYEEARAMFESARRAWRASRYPIGVAIATSNLGRLAVRGGDIDAGRKLLVDAKEQMDAIGSTMYAMEIEGRLVEALVFAGSDDSVGAAEEFVSHVAGHDVADTLAPWARRLLAVAAVQVGDRDRGRAELDKAVALAEDKGWEHELAMALAARASLAEVLGIGGQAAEDARRAVAIFGRLGIQDTPVTSLDDRWPSGPGAVALVAGAVAEPSP